MLLDESSTRRGLLGEKFDLRVPKSPHRDLARKAEEGVSLDRFVVTTLALFGALAEEELPADFEFGLDVLIAGLEPATKEPGRFGGDPS